MTRFRNLILLSFLGVLISANAHGQTGTLFHDCPTEGDATQRTRSDPALNVLKNREDIPANGFDNVHFDDLSAMEVPEGVSKRHRDKWDAQTVAAVDAEEKRAVRVRGVILKIKLEGPESPNCHLDSEADRDFHVWLANSADDEKADAVVVELTPRVRAKHPSWTRAALNQLTGPTKLRVRVSGWILLDPDHRDQVGKTRVTIWEIHPVVRIEVFRAGKWKDL